MRGTEEGEHEEMIEESQGAEANRSCSGVRYDRHGRPLMTTGWRHGEGLDFKKRKPCWFLTVATLHGRSKRM